MAPTGTLPIGLWLSARAAQQVADEPHGAQRLRDWLGEHGLQVVTLNAFPYHDFHLMAVKHRVYEPNWANTPRLLYTTLLADLLPALLPEGTRQASISTVPLGWRSQFGFEGSGACFGLASAMLGQLVRHLADIEARTGLRIHVDLEPEPGCAIDKYTDATAFFANAMQARRGEPDPRRHVGICHDICHSAVMFEEQAQVLRAYREAGIRVGKVQVSSAVTADGSHEALAVLSSFAEQRYLHQTCVRQAADGSPVVQRGGATDQLRDAAADAARGVVHFYEDLPLALAAMPAGEWRTHFHVPVFARRLGALGTTQGAIDDCLAEIATWPAAERPCFEVETYAWDVLPESALEEARPEDRAGGADAARDAGAACDAASEAGAGSSADAGADRLATGIAREIEWTRDRLRAAGIDAAPLHA